MRTNKIYWILAMVIVALLVVIYCMVKKCYPDTEVTGIFKSKTVENSVTSAVTPIVVNTDSIKLALLQAKHEESEMKSHDSIVILNYELKNCRNVKPTAKKITATGYKKATSKKVAPNVNANYIAPEEEFVSSNSFKPRADGLKSSSTYKTAISTTKFIGLKGDDYYVTISDDNYVQFAFAKRLYDEGRGTGVPELYYEGSGKFFDLDGDVYIYVDRSIPVTATDLNKSWTWCVFIGKKDGYGAYIPHELIKPEIMKAKNTLAGTISPEDVAAIGTYVPEVAAGRIKPNKLTATGDFDGLVYEGWSFCTKMMYKQQ